MCVGGSAGLLRVYDTASGRLRLELAGGDACVWGVDATRKLLASASDDRAVRLWDLRSQRVVARLSGHRAPRWSAARVGNGEALVSGDADGTIVCWDVRRLAVDGTIDGDGAAVHALHWREPLLYAAAASGVVRAYDVRLSYRALVDDEVCALDGEAWALASVDHGGRAGRGELFCAGESDGLRRLALPSLVEMAPLGGHEGGTAALAARLDADGTVQLACGGFARRGARARDAAGEQGRAREPGAA